MLKVISRRINHKDEGFTLIELMVVLVVIGILMAIAIPTFLGAKNKANDRSAQENVRNALTAEKEFFTDNQSYTITSASLAALEPALGWTTAVPATTTGNQVDPAITPTYGTGDNVMIQAQSASGGCVYIDDQALAPTSPSRGAKLQPVPTMRPSSPTAATRPASPPLSPASPPVGVRPGALGTATVSPGGSAPDPRYQRFPTECPIAFGRWGTSVVRSRILLYSPGPGVPIQPA